jgi:hypothetical protein
MSALPIGISQVTIEHLDDAADCCRDARETLERINRMNPTLPLGIVRQQLTTLAAQLTDMKAEVHKQVYAMPDVMRGTLFPVAQAAPCTPLR